MDTLGLIRSANGRLAYGFLTQGGLDQNVCVAPFGIQLGLSMLYFGSAGRARSTIADILGIEQTNSNDAGVKQIGLVLAALGILDDTSQFDVVNGLWINHRQGMNPSYRQAVKSAINGRTQQVDFAAINVVDIINRWVANGTRNRIEQILKFEDITDQLAAVITNANYIKPTWDRPFPRENIKPLPFQCPDRTKRLIPTMQMTVDALYYEYSTFRAVGLPHQGGRAIACLVLPSHDTSLQDVIESLSGTGVERLISRFTADTGTLGRRIPARFREARITLPRFTLDYTGDISPTLAKLGINDAFASAANYIPMGLGPGAWVEKYIHSATLKIDDEGAEKPAKAISGYLGIKDVPVDIVFDRPFICLDCDAATGLLLFAAAVRYPISEEITVDSLVRKAGFNDTGHAAVVEALQLAVTEANMPAVNMLLNSGTNINGRDARGATALHTASLNGPPEIIRYLLERGADVNAIDDTGRSPIWWAAINTKYDHMRILADNGASLDRPNAEGETLLIDAARGHVVPMVRFLVEREVNINLRNLRGETALIAAVQLIHPDAEVHRAITDIVDLLLANGGDPNDATPDGATLLLKVADSDAWRVARSLIDYGANIEARDREWMTPLLRAAMRDNAAIAKLLLVRGADTMAVDMNGENALRIAMRRGSASVVDALQKSGKFGPL